MTFGSSSSGTCSSSSAARENSKSQRSPERNPRVSCSLSRISLSFQKAGSLTGMQSESWRSHESPYTSASAAHELIRAVHEGRYMDQIHSAPSERREKLVGGTLDVQIQVRPCSAASQLFLGEILPCSWHGATVAAHDQLVHRGSAPRLSSDRSFCRARAVKRCASSRVTSPLDSQLCFEYQPPANSSTIRAACRV